MLEKYLPFRVMDLMNAVANVSRESEGKLFLCVNGEI